MSGPWDDRTPKTQYRMFWSGKWRPVLAMYDAGNQPTTSPVRAVKVVLFAWKLDGEGEMVGTVCGPADIFTNHGFAPANGWEVVH